MVWSASDSGSGVAGYDLQVRVDAGEWETLLSDSQATSYAYPADYARRYAFRVTASDNAGNVGQGEASASTANAVTKYYYFGGQRVAVRKPDGEVNWLHGDHLGSTSLATDEDRNEVSRQSYYPFGEVRWVSGTLPTDFGYTGQRLDATGLMFYHARYYAPQVGRFIQADMIVPDWSNPQYLNRYSYVRNNPLRYIDPTGRMDAAFDQGDAYSNAKIGPVIEFQEWQAEAYATGDYKYGQGWTADDTKTALAGLGMVLAVCAIPSVPGIAADAFGVVDAAGWKAVEWVLRHKTLSTLLGWAGQEVLDGDDDEAKAIEYLAQLPGEGDRVVVPRGQISAKIMALMSEAEKGVEFALYRSTDGLRYLIRGGYGEVSFPSDVSRLIAHAHPGTGPIEVTWADTAYISEGLNQAWSIVFNPDLQAVRFYQRVYENSPATLEEAWELAVQWLQSQ